VGKTTLLRWAAGLLGQDAGLRYGDAGVAHLTPRARAERRTYLPQETPGLLPFTVRDYLLMGVVYERRGFELPRWCDSYDDVCGALRIEMLLSRNMDALSGGERRRVAICRCMLARPRIHIWDEPLAGLDVQHVELVMQRLVEERRAGCPVLLSLHDLNQAARWADRVLLLASGTVAAFGSVGEVLEPRLLEQVYGRRMRVFEGPDGRPRFEADDEVTMSRRRPRLAVRA
jgi:iron complex transport system ATP-binding protein